jgi:hypothetical protein
LRCLRVGHVEAGQRAQRSEPSALPHGDGVFTHAGQHEQQRPRLGAGFAVEKHRLTIDGNDPVVLLLSQ